MHSQFYNKYVQVPRSTYYERVSRDRVFLEIVSSVIYIFQDVIEI